MLVLLIVASSKSTGDRAVIDEFWHKTSGCVAPGFILATRPNQSSLICLDIRCRHLEFFGAGTACFLAVSFDSRKFFSSTKTFLCGAICEIVGTCLDSTGKNNSQNFHISLFRSYVWIRISRALSFYKNPNSAGTIPALRAVLVHHL